MTTEWYYRSATGDEIGPVSSAEMRRQVQSKHILPDTPVRKAPSGDWVTAKHVRGLFDTSDEASPHPPAPAEKASPASGQSSGSSPTHEERTPPALEVTAVGPPFRRNERRGISYSQGLLIILLLLLVWIGPYLGTFGPPQRWEYVIASPSDEMFEQSMALAGENGWELVFARRATSGTEESANPKYEMIFKRPKSSLFSPP